MSLLETLNYNLNPPYLKKNYLNRQTKVKKRNPEIQEYSSTIKGSNLDEDLKYLSDLSSRSKRLDAFITLELWLPRSS